MHVYPVSGIPLVAPGDDLAAMLIAALERCALDLEDGDILVVTGKIAAKAEDRCVDLDEVQPSSRAVALARAIDRDPPLVEVILSQSEEVLRYRRGVLIVIHKLGFVMANAGVDASNIGAGGRQVLLLPEDPDRTCANLRKSLEASFAARIGVVMTDSVGRPWRNGVVGLAIGTAGVPALRSLVGRPDLYGRPLEVTEVAFADGVATAASLVMGEADEGLPAVIVRGLEWSPTDTGARALIRPKELDLFR